MGDYAIYLRKSRADIDLEKKGEMETLARHQNILMKLARDKELRIGKIYKEIVSGESISERPQMQELLKDVNARKWKGVLVVEVERLARGETKDQGAVAEAFKYSETLIITPTKTYDPNNEYDEEYFEFGLFMSRREYKTIRRRMNAGKLEAVKEGNYIASLPPFGYDIVKRGKKDRTLKPNDQAPYVQLIFEWFVKEGLGVSKIANRLTTMGISTLTGRNEWNRATVTDILHNPLYIGKIRWGFRKTTKAIEDDKVVKKRPLNDDFILVEGKHDAIISNELFEQAQEIFENRRNAPVKDKQEMKNPLAGILHCKHCGKAMVYVGAKDGRRSRIIHAHSVKCKIKSTAFDEVMDAFIYGLKMHISDFEVKMNNEDGMLEAKRQHELIESLEKELTTLKNQRAKLFDYLERKIYTEDEFVERKQILTEKITMLEYSINEEKQKEVKEVDYQEKIVTFNYLIDTLKNPNVPAKDKNDFIKKVINKVEYDCEDLGRGKGGRVILDIFLK